MHVGSDGEATCKDTQLQGVDRVCGLYIRAARLRSLPGPWEWKLCVPTYITGLEVLTLAPDRLELVSRKGW